MGTLTKSSACRAHKNGQQKNDGSDSENQQHEKTHAIETCYVEGSGFGRIRGRHWTTIFTVYTTASWCIILEKIYSVFIKVAGLLHIIHF